tara:strand:+ start:4020 stop:5234 length:1215 start_codon:yes stop_codon:yes gene_type:complete
LPKTAPNKASRGVAITGMGIASALGIGLSPTLSALKNSKTGIARPQLLQTHHASEVFVGEVKRTNQEIATELNLPASHNYTRTALLGCLAAKEATTGLNLNDGYKTGLISSTTVGGMDMTEQFLKTYSASPEYRKYINSHNAGDSSQKIAEQLGLTDFVSTISTACSSAVNAIMLGARMIKAGKLDRVIVGGVDALSKFTLNGFKSLMIMSDAHCKPFDQSRNGLNLGEAAAFLVLESEEVIQKENREVLAYLSGYGNANDAHHQTASSPEGEGAFLAMQKALDIAGLSPKEISYINAHGTATPNNDLSESVALKRIFGEQMPAFSSTKPFTGHTLAPAGAVEAVFSILALQNNLVFPNLNFENPIEETGLIPQTELKLQQLEHVLSNSFGFGGNCSTLIFSRA